MALFLHFIISDFRSQARFLQFFSLFPFHLSRFNYNELKCYRRYFVIVVWNITILSTKRKYYFTHILRTRNANGRRENHVRSANMAVWPFERKEGRHIESFPAPTASATWLSNVASCFFSTLLTRFNEALHIFSCIAREIFYKYIKDKNADIFWHN